MRLLRGRRRWRTSSTESLPGSRDKASTVPAVSTQVSRLVPPRCMETLASSRRATRVMPPGRSCQPPWPSATA